MVKKCSVRGCRTGYDSEEPSSPISIYSFPKGLEEKKEWLRVLTNIIEKATPNMGVCALHWPKDAAWVKSGRHLVPRDPPSIFPNVASSIIPSSTKPRSTMNSTSDIRHTEVDEMKQFREKDCIREDNLVNQLSEKLSQHGMFFKGTTANNFILMSHSRNGPVHSFVLYLSVYSQVNEKCTLAYELYQSELYQDTTTATNKQKSTYNQTNIALHSVYHY